MYKETTLVLGSDPAASPASAELLQSEAARMPSLLDVIYFVSYLPKMGILELKLFASIYLMIPCLLTWISLLFLGH